jgi:hypothetical protein
LVLAYLRAEGPASPAEMGPREMGTVS